MSRNSHTGRSRTPRDHANSVSHVEIKTVTWNKDSHGLFDYENSTYDMKKFSISNPSKFFRSDNTVHMQALDGPPLSISEASEPLIAVSHDRSATEKFVIDIGDQPEDGTRSPISPYLIVRSLKCSDGKNQRGFPLSVGQIIKLGRIEFRVLEICSKAGMPPEKINYHLYQHDVRFDIESENNLPSDGEVLCRFCYTDKIDTTEEIDGVMLYMCNCKGSSGGLHFMCLRQWINYKTVNKNQYNSIINYQLKKLECEVCLKPYPQRVSYKGNVHEFLTIARPQTPYLILERLVPDMSLSSNLSIVCLEDNQEIKIGRGHLCDLRVSDISVSRVHAMLKFVNEKFVVFDNDSKFGTLIYLDKNYPIKTEKAAIQMGRTVFTFVMKNQIMR